jgi:endo-alpha-1,4-polygalactosaminidase (GH114 family)
MMKAIATGIICLLLCRCSNKDEMNTPVQGNWFQPQPGISFDWRLDEVALSDSFDAQVVDLDAFSASKELVQQLHAQGKKLIGYISVGTVEDWRPDAADFPAAIIGNDYAGWEGEKWLDIRQIDKLGPILEARLDMIKEKGFDAVEPDNIDGFEYPDPGFPLSQNDGMDFCKWLIAKSHERGLSIGQKNAGELAADLSAHFDWMLTEEAFAGGWYEDAVSYIEKGKAVFATEYTDQMTVQEFENNVCPIAKENRFSAILKDRDLTAGKNDCN